MRFFVTVILLLISVPAMAQTQKYVFVDPGDVDGLKQAIVEAGKNQNVLTNIVSAGTFLLKDSGLPHIKSTMTLQGYPDPMIITGEGEGPGEMLVVDEGASFHRINVELSDFSLDGQGTGLIQNLGELRLTRVQLQNVYGTLFCLSKACNAVRPAIWNGENAQLFLNQVSIIHSGINSYNRASSGGLITNLGEAIVENSQLIARPQNQAEPLLNSGTMRLDFVTFSADSQSMQSRLISGNDGLSVSNSIISGFDAGWCTGTLSLGYNVIDNPECGFAAEGDKIGIPTGLLWRPVEANWGNSRSSPKILTHALVPVSASPAVDSIPNERCGNEQNLVGPYRHLDGNGDGVYLCDAGAIELRPITLAEGGINGVYFNPDVDGHYLSIFDSTYTTLVTWNSFDRDGKQYAVYGTGELVAGKSIIADAYITVNGGTSADGEILPAQDLHWGTLVVDMVSCKEATLAFNSDFPEYGSAQVSLERLVYVKQLGCVD